MTTISHPPPVNLLQKPAARTRGAADEPAARSRHIPVSVYTDQHRYAQERELA